MLDAARERGRLAYQQSAAAGSRAAATAAGTRARAPAATDTAPAGSQAVAAAVAQAPTTLAIDGLHEAGDHSKSKLSLQAVGSSSLPTHVAPSSADNGAGGMGRAAAARTPESDGVGDERIARMLEYRSHKTTALAHRRRALLRACLRALRLVARTGGRGRVLVATRQRRRRARTVLSSWRAAAAKSRSAAVARGRALLDAVCRAFDRARAFSAARSMHAWAAVTTAGKLGRRAREHARSRAMAAVLGHWATHTRARTAGRRSLELASAHARQRALAAAISLWHARALRARASASAMRHAARVCTSRALRAWAVFTAHRSRRQRSADAAVEHHNRTCAKRCFAAWALFTRPRAARCATTASVTRVVLLCRARHGIERWRVRARDRRRLRDILDAASAARAEMLFSRYWQLWRSWARAERRSRSAEERATLHAKVVCLRRAFGGWMARSDHKRASGARREVCGGPRAPHSRDCHLSRDVFHVCRWRTSISPSPASSARSRAGAEDVELL